RLTKISASISGVFGSKLSDFDHSKHYVRFNMNPGERITEILRTVEVEKVDANKPEPVLDLFRDLATDIAYDTLTPCNIGVIIGNMLKIDTTDTNQGIFFIAADYTETKVTTIARNMPSSLIFMIPDTLASGEYE